MKICMVNASAPDFPRENDSYFNFENYQKDSNLNRWKDGRWRSWHSMPCALETEFFAYNGDRFVQVYRYDGVIVLFNHEPHKLLPFVQKLKRMRKKVIVGFHEGVDEFLLMSQNLNWLMAVKALAKEAGAYLSLIPEFKDFFEGFLQVPCYPIVYGAPFFRWTDPPISKEKSGILIGTRTLEQRLRRNTLLVLGALNKLDKKITYVNQDKQNFVSDFLAEHFPKLNIVTGPLVFNEWMTLVAQHELVVEYDMCNTVGGIVQDAALVDVLAVGGNTSSNFINSTNILNFDKFLDEVNRYLEMSEEQKQFALNSLKRELCFDSLAGKINTIFEEL